ncbi:CcdC protein domain-containing protein [Paenibacillus sp. UNC451MF]|uniref:CcdC protein domain-containing protein n=1 Tax=Paenibacillus sp. UNC451MF TaxID=1449063 RepID=UPI00048D8519|nr:CcdC protein domain-containing protein [Paenibacillus sp. UNC451MF]
MTTQTFIQFIIIAVVIVLVIWLRSRRKDKPIRNKGYRMLTPLVLLLIVFGYSINSLTHIPDHPFHLPAIWEMLIAGVLGIALGSVMLYHTGYERREDGQIYAKRNKNFKYVIIAVIIIRVALSQYFKGLDYTEFTVLTMVMAYLYICVWRVGSFIKFRQVSSNS